MNTRDYIESLSDEEISELNRKEIKRNESMFKDFKDAFENDCCSLCGNKLAYQDLIFPCFHWFILPNNIRKKDFNVFLSEPIGFFQLESYFRWVASLVTPMKNINDIEEEISESKLKEVTIKFKNIEWSLNYGVSDLEGHLNSKNAILPHFHLQMLVDNRPFIRFNDFHIPFSKSDLFTIKLQKEESDLIEFSNLNGEGMSAIKNIEDLDEFDEMLTKAPNEEDAAFNTTTFFKMPKDGPMTGDDLLEIFNESENRQKPTRHILKEKYPESEIKTIINPGEGVPEMKKRNKRKK